MFGFAVFDCYGNFMDDSVIHIAEQGDLPRLLEISRAMEKDRDIQYFEIGLRRQAKGKAHTFIVRVDGEAVGYCLLNMVPKYQLYERLGIPEIQDLNIMPDFRRRGLGRQLVLHCEDVVRALGLEQIGISFGLDSSFGSAQRLYVQMGYVPDGYGVTYDRRTVRRGEICRVDDDLCLMMVKDL